MSQPSLSNELRKRLFWSCYNLDRQVSIPLGRPFALSNREIDVPLPLDVDEATEDIAVLQEAFEHQPTTARQTSTTLSLFVQMIKLRMIESRIQEQVYRVDSAVEASDAEIDAFVSELAEWKAMIPLDVQNKPDYNSRPIDAYENYVRTRLHIRVLFPFVYNADAVTSDGILLSMLASIIISASVPASSKPSLPQTVR